MDPMKPLVMQFAILEATFCGKVTKVYDFKISGKQFLDAFE